MNSVHFRVIIRDSQRLLKAKRGVCLVVRSTNITHTIHLLHVSDAEEFAQKKTKKTHDDLYHLVKYKKSPVLMATPRLKPLFGQQARLVYNCMASISVFWRAYFCFGVLMSKFLY
jgi:hypothetical protein